MATLHLFLADLAFAAVTAAVLGLATVAFSLQYAVSNVLNLAFGELLTLAAYFAYAGSRYGHIPVWLAGLLAIALVGLFSLGLNHLVVAPFSRRSTSAFTPMIVTFAISAILEHLVVAVFGPNSFSLPLGNTDTALRLGDFALSFNEIATIVMAVLAMVALQVIVKRTLFGKAMRAIVDNRSLARACGIRATLITDLAWFISGCLAGIAGLALLVSTGTANSLLGTNFLLFIIPAAFLGGMGSMYGAMIGAVVIAFASDWSSILFGSEYKVVIGLVVLLLIFFLRPSGIVPMPARRWEGGK
jgi:branched-subunit amino acid ABC-type transport system permease component